MNDKETDNNIEENTSQSSQMISQSIGQILKTARKAQNIEIADVCNQLNLSSHVVEALESDNYEGLPEIAYIRGYIVSYCRLLGLDSFNVLKQLVTDDPSLSVASSIGSSITMNNSNQGFPLLKKIIPVIILALIAFAAYWFFTQNGNSLISNGEGDNTSPNVVQNPANNSENNSAQPASSSQGTATDAVTSNTESSSESTANDTLKTTTDGVVDEAKKSLLELEFNSVSWVDIQNPKKEKIVYQSFPRGEKHQVKAELPLNIFIDNAAGVFMRYQGRLIDLKPYIQDGYAKFTLSE